jgi:hypothetical protein
MRRPSRSVWLTAAALGVSAAEPQSARAQPYFTNDVTARFSVSWREVDAAGQPVATPNELLEPGEGARISVSLGLTPGVGTAVPYYERVGTRRRPARSPGWDTGSLILPPA